MARGRNSSDGIRKAGAKSAVAPVNLSRYGASRPATLLPDRRRAWFVTLLAACGTLAGAGGAVLVATQGSNDAAATVPVHVDLRPLSVPDTDTLDRALARPNTASLAPEPIVTGALQDGARNDAQAGDLPPLRRLDDNETGQGANPVVERAAIMAIYAASYGLPRPQSAVDKPTIIGDSAPQLRLASLGAPTNMTVLVKRTPTASTPPQSGHSIVISKGDTLYDILDRFGVETSDAVALTQALAKVFPPSGLRTGQEINLTLRDVSDERSIPLALALVDDQRDIEVRLERDGTYVAKVAGLAPGQRTHHRALATIKGSLYGSARAEGVPDSLIVRMMRIHSYDVDFQRDIRAGDRFEVFYATGRDTAENSSSSAQVLYSSLSTKGESHGYYRFTAEDGAADYYDESGVSSKKPLMKTPINGARISSNFGMRKHPILGYTKLHGGTDFAAPTGTPILAAGDGKVEVAGRSGGYGNYIRITHKDGVKTAYAHMSRFAKGIKPGKQVRQGDVIGFVGTTGRSTGPHLHYEVHLNGKKQNPQTVKVAGGGRRLEGTELARFLEERDRIDALRTEAPVEALVAAAQP